MSILKKESSPGLSPPVTTYSNNSNPYITVTFPDNPYCTHPRLHLQNQSQKTLLSNDDGSINNNCDTNNQNTNKHMFSTLL